MPNLQKSKSVKHFIVNYIPFLYEKIINKRAEKHFMKFCSTFPSLGITSYHFIEFVTSLWSNISKDIILLIFMSSITE